MKITKHNLYGTFKEYFCLEEDWKGKYAWANFNFN